MALWMDKGSESLTESEKADLDAIAAIKESSALELKEEGNRYVKMGKKHYSRAVDCYTRAIHQKALGDSESSVLYANRAHVNMLLGNYRRALSDAQEAIKLCSTNVKAIYRAAKAAFRLDLLEDAASFCKSGLEQFPTNEELEKLALQVDSKKQQQEKHNAELSCALSTAKDLASAVGTRGLKLGKPMYQELIGVKKPILAENNILHWPVLLLYAEVMSSDFIEDFCENDTFSDHLDMMYSGNCQPLPWDKESCYSRDAIELYYQAGSGTLFSGKEVFKYFLEGTAAALVEDSLDEESDSRNTSDYTISTGGSDKWVKVNEKKTLRDILCQQEYIIPGIPVFFVISKRSPFYKEFKSGKWTPP